MSIEDVREYALSLPGTCEDMRYGEGCLYEYNLKERQK